MNTQSITKNLAVGLTVFYITAFGSIILMKRSGSYRSGPCNLGLDIFLFLILGLFILSLLLISGIFTLRNKESWPVLLVNITAIVAWGIYLVV